MTASGSGAPDRELTTDEASRQGFGRALAAILAAGLIVRLILAYGIDGLRGSGFAADLGLFNYWAEILAEHGPPGFYANASYADYTPGYMVVLWVVGLLREAGTAMGLPDGLVDGFIKLPAILTDIALAWLVASMARELGVSGRRALVAAAVVVVNPITWFDSVIWGQVDSFGTVFLLLGVRELWRGRHERAAILAVVAGLIKPQLAILVPIVAVVTIRRALWPAGGWGDEAEPRRRGFAWEHAAIGWKRIVTTGVAGYATALALATPFGLSVFWPSATAPYVESGLLRLIFSTAATYPYLTVNAFNWWALFPVEGRSVASEAFIHWFPDSPIPDAAAWGQVAGVPAAVIGAVLLLGTAALVAWVVARRPDRLTILVGVAVLAIAFFAAPTRVHERYLFPFFGLGAILLAVSARWAVAYVVAGVATFLNMYVILVGFDYGTPQVTDWLGIRDLVLTTPGIAAIALAHSAVFLWSLAQLRPGARKVLAAELEAARAGPGEGLPATSREAGGEPAGVAPAPAGVAPAPAGAGAPPTAGAPAAIPDAGTLAGASSSARSRLVPAWFDRPSWTAVGPVTWLRTRVAETPVRPDRSWLLVGERRGRVDRLDLLLLLMLVVGALLLRTYRVGEPARMHFDEVYHARTAAEFLQDWRYGIPHDIYEWTHPHLAKYAMAAGIVAFAGNDVEASSDLGVPVRDAVIEPRREDPTGGGDRSGERLWTATGSELIAWDLRTRAVEARWSLPGAAALAFDDNSLQVLVGTDGGEVYAIDTTVLDLDREAPPETPSLDPRLVTSLDGGVVALEAFQGGAVAAAILDDGAVPLFGIDAGTLVGTARLDGPVALAPVDDVKALVAVPALVEDPDATAVRLVELMGGDEAGWRAALSDTSAESVHLDADPTDDERSALQEAMDAGELPGIEFQPVPTLAVADADGLTFIDAGGIVHATVPVEGGARGLAQVSGIEDGSQVYATVTDPLTGDPEIAVVDITGEAADTGPAWATSFPLPAPGSTVVFDEAAELVEVLGTTPDGTQPTVYVVEPHGRSVFADHRLPFTPAALALDHDKQWPATSEGDLLAFAPDGAAASMDVGSYHFSWRLPGVIAGALTVAVLYLLGRVLFARRAVAVLVGLFVVLDGMFFVQSRIAMNDVYVGLFILAAYLLFAWLWLEPERVKRAFWVVAPVMGVLLGLALASKWVAAYAIGALGILVLMRTALGRVILVLGMVAVTAVLGWMALAVPADTGGLGNLPFVLIMIGLTLAAVVISVYRPVAWSDDEIRFAIGAPALLGILVAFTAVALGRGETTLAIGPAQFTPVEAGFALVVVGVLAALAFWGAGRLGFGPMAPLPDRAADGPPPPAPAPDGWVRLGWGLGIPAAWLVGSLLVIPLAVYVLSYLPWAWNGTGQQIVEGFPAGNGGETLLDLTRRMYEYHNGLTAAHAASSPWWAWPLNLKPVWFYQGSYAEGTAASIYDAGNLVIWWLGIPAMVFVAYQAFKRRSLGLALILVAFLAQWVSWARIDRAAFQYHYYTSLPFVVLALGYFVAEIWHGPSRRTWLLARVAAAVALMGPVLLWLLRYPLCAIADVESVNAGSQACNGNPGNLMVTPAAGAMAVVALVTAGALVWQLAGLGRSRADEGPVRPRDLVPIVLTAGIGGVALAVARLLPDSDPLFTVNGVIPELIALIVAVPLGLVALQVLTARDARRFVGGLLAAAGAWFLVLYPNISALAMPSALVNAYQGLLPTYLYAFQFTVNTTARPETSFADPRFLVLLAFLVVACGVVAYAAWAWRQALAEPAGDAGPGPAEQAGPA